jgi:hypothetical protein
LALGVEGSALARRAAQEHWTAPRLARVRLRLRVRVRVRVRVTVRAKG